MKYTIGQTVVTQPYKMAKRPKGKIVNIRLDKYKEFEYEIMFDDSFTEDLWFNEDDIMLYDEYIKWSNS